VVRRLGPDSRKLERKNGRLPLKRKLLAAMGAELANIHAVDRETADLLRADIDKRRMSEFSSAAARTAEATYREWEGHKARG
jgi:hypothetical protein